jgi:hypothetical protein
MNQWLVLTAALLFGGRPLFSHRISGNFGKFTVAAYSLLSTYGTTNDITTCFSKAFSGLRSLDAPRSTGAPSV